MRVPILPSALRTSPPAQAHLGTSDLRLALFEPDIPQNTGALLRLAACFGVAIDLIEPFGFVFDDRRLRRAVLDYAARVEIHRHRSWDAFLAARHPNSRLALLPP